MPQKTPTMNPEILEARPEMFWQEIVEPGTYESAPGNGHRIFFPAQLADGRQLALPIRRKNGTNEALASLIINQASLAVLDTLAGELANLVRRFEPAMIVAMPTLGLPLAQETARRLGHARYLPLSTSKKFWYDDALSVPLRSVTSPDQQKHLYLDPRMLPLLKNRPLLLVDDVVSTGASVLAASQLLENCGVKPDFVGCAMLQTDRWRDALTTFDPDLPDRVFGVFSSPLLHRGDDGGWHPEQPRATKRL